MLYVNLNGPQLLYSAHKFGQVFLTRTVYVCTCTYANMYVRTTLKYCTACRGSTEENKFVAKFQHFFFIFIQNCSPIHMSLVCSHLLNFEGNGYFGYWEWNPWHSICMVSRVSPLSKTKTTKLMEKIHDDHTLIIYALDFFLTDPPI